MSFSPVSYIANTDLAGNSVRAEHTASIAANAASTTVVKNGSGRVVNILVTVAGSATVGTIYDNTAGSGTVLAIVPAAATVGTQITVDMPAGIGITVVQGATSPGITVGYS
jgi:hypothetical protein